MQESDIREFIDNFSYDFFKIQLVFAALGFLITIPHLTILLQNAMRTSSTNSLLIGIAFSDIFVLLQIIFDRTRNFFIAPRDNDCVLNTTYTLELLNYIGEILRDTCERSSFIFGSFLALLRLLILKSPNGFENLCKPFTGYLIVVNLLIINFLTTLYNYLKYKIVFAGYWTPPEECTMYPANYSEKIYYLIAKNEEELMNFYNNYMVVNGISRILIAVIYPVLAILLVLEIWKSAKAALKMLSQKEALERLRTARMILLMTLTYVVVTGPIGILNFIQLFIDLEMYPILNSLEGSGHIFTSLIYCLNVISHGFINYAMSTNYRKATKQVFCLKEKEEVQDRMFAKTVGAVN
ncbi:hypothetical protein B9Z55_017333 [Caenorhabditis nigoni]|uniref:G-protein coupled receptors family 1 profile domain-containing protein n=1 Tax=Caenorhabditis nigoni TaxID=1611254 RepID=A0A2G5T8Q1_9PELO|nr:hypothetical protein B9Z55_017333 [Caenorhabditis nigoni]